MQIHTNPASAKITGDFKVYRNIYDTNPLAKKEIRDQLKKHNPVKWGNPSDNLAKGYDAYKDYAYGKDPTDPKPLPEPNRLGGQLPASKPKPPPGPKSPEVIYAPLKQNPTKIEVRTDGTIVHTDSKGNQNEHAHEYMHAIFDDIMYDARDKLEAINTALERHLSATSPNTADAYTAAVGDWNKFVADLRPKGNSPYANAFNFVNIAPVVTNEGFIVSARVELDWKNPSHSSSTVKVP